MMTPKSILTPQRVVSLGLFLPCFYVLMIGPERFYYESWGTWIMSPVIYTRISPYPLNLWLVRGFLTGNALTCAVLAAPIVILLVSAVLAWVAIAKNSIIFAFSSVALAVFVFTVYHFLQPLGISYVSF